MMDASVMAAMLRVWGVGEPEAEEWTQSRLSASRTASARPESAEAAAEGVADCTTAIATGAATASHAEEEDGAPAVASSANRAVWWRSLSTAREVSSACRSRSAVEHQHCQSS